MPYRGTIAVNGKYDSWRLSTGDASAFTINAIFFLQQGFEWGKWTWGGAMYMLTVNMDIYPIKAMLECDFRFKLYSLLAQEWKMPFIHLPVFAQSAYVSLVSWTKSFDPSSHRSHLDRYLLTWEFFFFGQVTSHVVLMPTQSSQVVYRQPRPIIKLLLFRCKFALSPIYECFFLFFPHSI